MDFRIWRRRHNITRYGWDLADIQAFLASAVRHPEAAPTSSGEQARQLAPALEVQPIVTGEPGIKMTHLPLMGLTGEGHPMTESAL